MSELFREIEEEVKRERIENIWRSFGRFAVWGSIGIIAATAIFVAWDNYSQNQAEIKTAQLVRGAERVAANDYKGANQALSALTDDDASAYYTLAMLQKASAQEKSGDFESARKTYDALAKKDSTKEGAEFASLAKLKIDSKDLIEVSPASPFYHSIAERNAWQLLRAGKKTEAADIFLSLMNDENAPRSIAARANEALRVIAPVKLTEKPAVTEKKGDQ